MALDEPHGAFYGAEVAAPVFQQIATRLMSLKGVAEDDPTAIEPLWARLGWATCLLSPLGLLTATLTWRLMVSLEIGSDGRRCP